MEPRANFEENGEEHLKEGSGKHGRVARASLIRRCEENCEYHRKKRIKQVDPVATVNDNAQIEEIHK